jgi:hypothetical protein
MSRFSLGVVFLCAVLCGCTDEGRDPTDPVEPQTAQEFVDSNFTPVHIPNTFNTPGWRDPDGIIWGAFLLGPSTEDAVEGPEGCPRYGGALPTAGQLDQFARYLGKDTPFGFRPELLTWAIPGDGEQFTITLSGRTFWSSTFADGADVAMDGDTGELGPADPADSNYGLCVF